MTIAIDARPKNLTLSPWSMIGATTLAAIAVVGTVSYRAITAQQRAAEEEIAQHKMEACVVEAWRDYINAKYIPAILRKKREALDQIGPLTNADKYNAMLRLQGQIAVLALPLGNMPNPQVEISKDRIYVTVGPSAQDADDKKKELKSRFSLDDGDIEFRRVHFDFSHPTELPYIAAKGQGVIAISTKGHSPVAPMGFNEEDLAWNAAQCLGKTLVALDDGHPATPIITVRLGDLKFVPK